MHVIVPTKLFLCYIIEWYVCTFLNSVTLIGDTQAEFEPYGEKDDIEDCLELIELFLTANSVAKE